MKEADVIKESHSLWAVSIVLVKKEDGKQWFCVSCQKLNQVTDKDAYHSLAQRGH